MRPAGWTHAKDYHRNGVAVRHSLAAQGIRTYHTKRELALIKRDPMGDADKDGVPNRYDCRPFDPTQQGRLHDYISKTIGKDHPASKAFSHVWNLKQLKAWWRRHHKAFYALGIATLLISLDALIQGPGRAVLDGLDGTLKVVAGAGAELIAASRVIASRPIPKQTMDSIVRSEIRLLHLKA
jgi:hypothetical protein